VVPFVADDAIGAGRPGTVGAGTPDSSEAGRALSILRSSDICSDLPKSVGAPLEETLLGYLP